jgi:hypothetical protein
MTWFSARLRKDPELNQEISKQQSNMKDSLQQQELIRSGLA